MILRFVKIIPVILHIQLFDQRSTWANGLRQLSTSKNSSHFSFCSLERRHQEIHRLSFLQMKMQTLFLVPIKMFQLISPNLFASIVEVTMQKSKHFTSSQRSVNVNRQKKNQLLKLQRSPSFQINTHGYFC